MSGIREEEAVRRRGKSASPPTQELSEMRLEETSNADRKGDSLIPKEKERNPPRPTQPNCMYHLRSGNCRYGASCKFNHPQVELGNPSEQSQVVSGSPMSVGQQECKFYLSPGGCRYGNACWYRHHQETNQTGRISLRFPNFPLQPNPATGSSSSEQNAQHVSAQILEDPSEKLVPERALQTNYPLVARMTDSTICTVTRTGLPLRPDQPICRDYSRFGVCIYGPACTYNHPLRYGSSVSKTAASSSKASNPDGRNGPKNGNQ